MRNLNNPKWLFILNTLPIVVLGVLLFKQYQIINTLLDDNSIRLWKIFGFTLGSMGLLNFIYALYLTLNKKKISAWYAVVALGCYISYIYLYGCYLEEILSFSIPRWMLSDNFYFYVGSFLMPTLAYSLFVLVLHFTSDTKKHKAWVNFLIAIGIPTLAYLFLQIVLPLWQPLDRLFDTHVILVTIISATLIFHFFLIRGVYILSIKKTKNWKKFQLAWKIPISLLLPLIGLAVYNKIIGKWDIDILGNFHNTWFYILAIVNAVLICLPNLESKLYRLILFFGRSITFSYTLYFFLVFLPLLPLAVIVIVILGLGFLILTPLLLFIIHANELVKDFEYLAQLFSRKILVGVFLFGFIIIPSSITLTYLKDKRVLHKTLSYIYTPDYSKNYKIDNVSLLKTLNTIKTHKSIRDNRGSISSGTPFLSSYFNWLVLDNLTLSDSKINNIENIFFGNTSLDLQPNNTWKDDVQISAIATKSIYDKSQNAWKSWVDLEITNNNTSNWQSEYTTTINLPEGCWISDYYLYVGDRKEPGILAEKKSAMWVYSQIRSTNQDPGILYYLTGNKIAFKVFPFEKQEVRKTGIEFLHKEPVELNIDGNIIELGNLEETVYENIETKSIAYVSTQQKQNLKRVKRSPYFHFLVDVSKEQASNSTEFINRIEKLKGTYQNLFENAKISFVNSYVTTTKLDANWKQEYKKQNFEGGFYLDRAIKTALIKANQDKSKTYPVIVVVTDTMQNAILKEDFKDFRFTFPENDLFYIIDKDGNLKEHSLTNNPAVALPERLRECMFYETVLEYELPDNSVAYLAYNNEPSIILLQDIFEVSKTDIKEKNWHSAMIMQAQWYSQILHPENSDKEWLNMVRNSFLSKVMTPVTSYLVVENEAQKAILKKKQEQVLSGNKSLDLQEETQRMSEPSLIVLSILLGIVLWIRKKRKQPS